MKHSNTYKEAKRLFDLGFACHWLHPKSKRPIESGWTSGPRKTWPYLKETYIDNLNLGVRLGTPSKIGPGFLCVVDVDVKSTQEHHKKEAVQAAKALLKGAVCPMVKSGRGNGSRHYYCLTAAPFKTYNPCQSKETVKVFMPSIKPSKKELEQLSSKEIADGLRLRPAWDISLYSDGRQVVLPPSIHPDSGEQYTWYRTLEDERSLPLIEFEVQAKDAPNEKGLSESLKPARESHNFSVEPVELSWLPISDRVKAGIQTGDGVDDRSGFLLQATTALVNAGLSTNEILTVLTDRTTFLGHVGFDHAKTNDRARAANWVHRYTVDRVQGERNPQNIFKAIPENYSEPQLEGEALEKQNLELSQERHWAQDLSKTGTGNIKPTVENVVLILTNIGGKDFVLKNEFSDRESYSENTPWGGKKGAALTDVDTAKIKYWLGVNWGFEPGDKVILDAITIVADKNAFDPVKDYLEALPAWDETPRLDTWLVKHFEASGNKEYLAQVFRKWMVAMVMRVYKPGAKFDWMPIFEGAQGVGKSSFGRLLVGEDYFLDWLPNLSDKDSAQALQGMWAVEMGELANMRKNELEVVKAYITRKVDKFRPPFGKKAIEARRRCVFFGTTNRDKYLADDSGNRRFKPVMVGQLNFDVLKKEKDQLFAEAKYLWDKEIETELSLELTGKARDFEKEIHGDKMVEDESTIMAEAVQDFIEKVTKEEVHFDLEKFRILELFQGVGCLSKWKADNRNAQFAAKAIKRLGGEFRKIKGSRYWKLPKGAGFEGTPDTLDFY